ncbi:MAG: hypothetical protein A2W19_03105 [Spirochaetes bacterium RBG_16_49_21]|nr:MAG: hypothetical protein A2W19_03105 [Spirochaetes bacterium RBG_16_49_21]
MSDKNTESFYSYRGLALILAALLCLTALTIAVSRIDLGPFKIWASLLISAAKSALVLIFFMQIGRMGRAVAVTFIVTLSILAIFIGFIFFDIEFR